MDPNTAASLCPLTWSCTDPFWMTWVPNEWWIDMSYVFFLSALIAIYGLNEGKTVIIPTSMNQASWHLRWLRQRGTLKRSNADSWKISFSALLSTIWLVIWRLSCLSTKYFVFKYFHSLTISEEPNMTTVRRWRTKTKLKTNNCARNSTS